MVVLDASYDTLNIAMRNFAKTIIITLVVVIGLFVFLYFFGGSLLNKFFPVAVVTQNNSENYNNKISLGKNAPYFDLLSLTGTRVRLSDLSGSGSVITFWSTWNSESVDQIKILDDYLAKDISNKQLPINMITINSQEEPNVVNNFIHRGGYNLKVLVDPNGATSNNYDIQTLPTTFFLNKNGDVLEIFVGTLSETMLVDKIEKIIN